MLSLCCKLSSPCFNLTRENPVELLQRYRRDRHVLLNYILSGNLIKKVVMPPGAISLDDVDIDQVSVDYVLNCAKKGEVVVASFKYLTLSPYICTDDPLML